MEDMEILELFELWKNGILPCEGAWLDQSADYVTAMRHLSRIDGEHRKEEQEKEQAKVNQMLAKAKGGGGGRRR